MSDWTPSADPDRVLGDYYRRRQLLPLELVRGVLDLVEYPVDPLGVVPGGSRVHMLWAVYLRRKIPSAIWA